MKLYEIQSVLGVSEPTIYRMINDGMPVYKYKGANRFDYEECKGWMKKNAQDNLAKKREKYMGGSLNNE